MQDTHSDILEFISQAELRFRVDEWKIDQTLVWPLVRILVASELIAFADFKFENQISKNQGLIYRSKRVLGSLFESMIAEFRDRAHNATVDGRIDVLFLICSTTRFFKVDGEWYNPYSDSFIKHLKDKSLTSLVLETAGDCEYRIPRFRESFFIQNRLFLLAALSRIKAKIFKPKNEELPGFPEFVLLLRETFGYERFGLSTLRRRFYQFELFQKYFKRLLTKTKPFVTVNDGYYSLDRMAFIQACRRLNIPSIEIQHGVQGENHFAYRKWERMPSEGYPMLPTVFWCWGENEFENLMGWTQQHREWHRPMVGDNPCLRVYSKEGKEVAESFSARIRNAQSNGHHSVQIIFTLQAFYGVPEFLLDAIEQSPASWRWWLRVHPQYEETREHIRNLLQTRQLTNYLIEEASEVPLGALLSHMDVHVTEFSSSVLEAEALGVPSVVINKKGAALYRQEMNSGIVREAYTAEALLDAVQSQSQLTRGLRSKQKNRAAIFEKAVSDEIVRPCLQGVRHVG